VWSLNAVANGLICVIRRERIALLEQWSSQRWIVRKSNALFGEMLCSTTTIELKEKLSFRDVLEILLF